MTGTLRPPEHFVHGLIEPEVIVPARVAVWLDRNVGLDNLRQQAGDPLVRNVLTALALVSANSSATAWGGSNSRQLAEQRALSTVMTTSEAASALRVSDRGIRLAIQDGRLIASKNTAGHWRITRADLEDFRAARAA